MHEQVTHPASCCVTETEAEEFKRRLDGFALLPLPTPERPEWKRHRSARLRTRQKHRLQVWRVACGLVNTINALNYGEVDTKLTSPEAARFGRVKATAARTHVVQRLLSEASAIARERRSCGLTGVQSSRAVASLLKQPVDDLGYMNFCKVKQVPLEAARLVEPPDTRAIDMLAALPAEDACFYEHESNVIDVEGKSESMFKELESHYGFIGGSEQEYLKYLERDDVQHLWQWDHMRNIRAIAGVSAVPKKNPEQQRKLIMQVAANYMMVDPSSRAHLGMDGGGALSRCYVPSGKLGVSICDEDSAFTFVRVPEWMTRWQGGPPVRAAKVWHLLPPDLKSEITDPLLEFVSPRYLRLAMGGSHSVYILMRINLEHIGRALFQYIGRVNDEETTVLHPSACDKSIVEEFCKDMISDSAWKRRQDIRKQAVDNVAAGFTVSQWCDAVRATKRQGHRVFVWMHFFAGRRQDGDVEEFAQKLAEAKGLQLMYISIDLATDHRWDLTIPCTFHALYQLVEEGLVDGVLGEPPCSTVASSRHVPLTNGPRPLRFRHCFWGREDLKLWERARVLEANCLWLNYMSLCEGVSSRGGVHLFAHPADPGVDPYPSLWQTAEMINMERRTGAIRVHLHPCHYGGPEAKLTCLSGTVHGLIQHDGAQCPGLSDTHTHGPPVGRTFPRALCEAIAKMFIDTFVHFEATNTGPTGALRLTKDVAAPRVTAWSTWCEQRRHGAVLLNEATVRRQAVVLSPLQSAVYVHVDDTVCLSDASQGPIFCDKIMDGLVSALEEVGFGVSQQERNDSATKVVGYEVIRNPAGFRLPIKKMVLLMEALKFVASCKMVRIRVLHALVGVWVFGALLRRELLSVPQAVFSFLTFHEEAEEKEATWWPSARREVLAMARLVPLMTCRVGSPLPQWLFATDAMGANELDSGGYGIVMTKITEHEALDLLRQSNAEGRAIAGLDGMHGAKFPGRALTPTVPFTLLSEELFCPERWVLVESGRWRFSEHITLGESRTVVKLLRKIAAVPELHGSLVLSLQDNRPTACSMTKGRSPSFPLNRLLRQKAAVCLAGNLRVLLPWVESGKQPADESSRQC